MSVDVLRAAGQTKKYTDNEAAIYCYKIEPNAVLTILSSARSKVEWIVEQEWSPTGYAHVLGTRFIGNTAELEGISGVEEEVHEKVQIF